MAPRYRIDPERSRLRAEARSSLHPITIDTVGLAGFIEAEVADGALDLSKPVRAVVEIAAARLRTGNALYDGELARRLEVQRHPRVRGEVRTLTLADAASGRYRVTGELTFHGVSQTLTGDVFVQVKPDAIEANGEQVIDIRSFGLEPPHLLMLRVYPEVRVRALVFARREA